MDKPRPRVSVAARRQAQTQAPAAPSRRLSRLFTLSAVVVLVVGGLLSWRQWQNNRLADHKAAILIYQANHNINHSVPSTNKPTATTVSSYTVGPTLPRYIMIPKINVKAIVRQLGITTGGQLEAPDNVYDTGWYTGSAKPGTPGAMLIDGHVSSWTAQGVFYDLTKLRSGDSIQVERGDGTIFNYTVKKTQTYDNTAVDMTAVLAPVNPTKPGLNLITCTGEVINGTNEFNKRIVIFATQN